MGIVATSADNGRPVPAGKAGQARATNGLGASAPESLHTGLKRRILLFSILFLILMAAATWEVVSRSQAQVIEYQARELAEVVARLAASARSAYTERVIDKLKAEGTGAHLEYRTKKGYVPLPAQFLKYVGQRASLDSDELYRYRPLSKWNLAEDQNLTDEFQRWAWEQLEAQSPSEPGETVNWKPTWRIEYMDGVRTMRYMRADPAVSQACVECHNAYERTPEIMARRHAAGLEPGRQLGINQLLGAIEVDIPLTKVEMLAQDQTRLTLVVVLGIVVVGLATIGLFVFVDVTRARGMARQLSWQANHDSLTFLANRSVFDQRLTNLIERSRRDHTCHALLFLDLDQFKIVNDTCGHAAGDELLRQTSTLLKSQLRGSDTLARLGGDEFGVLLQDCEPEAAMKVAETLRRAVREFRFVWDNRTFEIGVSIGVVAITPQTESAAEVMSAVDLACYAAKDGGRNRVHLLQPTDTELQRRRTEMEWASFARAALESDRLQLAVQDAVALNGETQPRRYREVLLRMMDENGNPMPTGTLISAAERYDLMPDIDRAVIRRAFRLVAERSIRIAEDELLAINISGVSINDENFLDYIRNQFWEYYDVAPSQICFEITETSAIRNFSKASRFIRSMKHLGCRFALDDFGSGLSSFGYLKKLPVDFLKIDGEFIRDIATDPLDRAMVQATVDIARVMGIPTIAEWVENEAVLRRVRELGVTYAQGFGVHKPKLIGAQS